MLLIGSLGLGACSTAKGLGPVDKYLSEKGTVGKVYSPWIEEKVANKDIGEEEAKVLKEDLDEARKNVSELREKKYAPFSFILGESFQKDLAPIYDFLTNQNDKKFKFKEWIEEKEKDESLDSIVAEQFLLNLQTMQDIVRTLMNANEPDNKRIQ